MRLRTVLAGCVAASALTGAIYANDLTFAGAGNPAGAGDAIASELSGSVDNLGFRVLLEPSTGGYLDTNTLITFTLTGATFAGPVTIDHEAAAAAGCQNANLTISAGGADGDSSVTVIGDTLSGCTGAANEHIQLDFTLDIPNGSDASIAATVVTEAGRTPIGGGASDPLTIATWESAFNLQVTPAGTAPVAELPGFTALATDNLGSVTLTDTNGAQYNLTMASNLGITNIDGAFTSALADVTVTGDYTGLLGLRMAAGGTVAPVAGVVSFLNEIPPGLGDLDADEDGVNAIVGGTYTVQATLDTGAVTGYSPLVVTNDFVIVREGVDFTFPYTLDQATVAAAAGTTVRYRISNNGGIATGPVRLQMRSWDATPTDTGLVELAASIPAGADLVFTPAQIEALVGAYGVGDFVVNVEAEGDNNGLTASYAMITATGTTNYAVLR